MSGGAQQPALLIVADAGAWRAWLDEHEYASDGVWPIALSTTAVCEKLVRLEAGLSGTTRCGEEILRSSE